MSATLAVLTIVVVGVMVGVEFSVAFVINPITLRLSDDALISARADGARMLGRAMPFWYIGSMILAAVLAVATWSSPTAVYAVIGAGLLAISVVMSIVLLVPINSKAAAWTAEEHPADWREQHHRWDRLHYARLAVITAGFAMIAVAATLL
jgi:hypothetical protein